jgi:hypothetical protein
MATKKLVSQETARDCAVKMTDLALRQAEGRGMGAHYAIGILQSAITSLLAEKYTEAEVKKVMERLKV